MYGLDLFSGIGGITKALEPYVQPVAYCENDRYAQAVLLSRMADGSLPVAPIWDDVRTLKGGILPELDIIYGGFPCQDISVAGRGAGLAGKRSGLFFEIVRLVSEIRPRFIFLENVSAITRRGGDVVVGTLASLGYDCRWTLLCAADVGAPHLRERWWLLAHARGDSRTYKRMESKNGNHSDGFWEDSKKWGINRNISKMGTPPLQRVAIHWEESDAPSTICRMVDGIPNKLDRLKSLGNSVVPAQAREAFERLMGLK